MAGARPGEPGRAPTSPEPADAGGADAPDRRASRWWWVAGLAIAALVVIVLAPLASTDPDGLERVAEDQGWIETALDPVFSLIPDYSIPGLDGEASTIVAGLVGIVIVFVLMIGLGRLLRRRREARDG
jgi:hypothetical protein